jgi:hypothetical protein
VRFVAPRAVAAISSRGDTLEVPGVRAVGGHVVAARGDTLVLWVTEMDPGGAPVHGWRTTVVRTAEDQVSVRQKDTGGSLFLIGALVGVMALVAAIVSSLDFS